MNIDYKILLKAIVITGHLLSLSSYFRKSMALEWLTINNPTLYIALMSLFGVVVLAGLDFYLVYMILVDDIIKTLKY